MKKVLRIVLIIFILSTSTFFYAEAPWNYENLWISILLVSLETCLPQVNILFKKNGGSINEICYRYIPYGFFFRRKVVYKYSKKHREHLPEYQYSSCSYIMNDKHSDDWRGEGSVYLKIEPYFEWGYLVKMKRNRYSLGLRFYFPIGFDEKPKKASTIEPLAGIGYLWMPEKLGNRIYVEAGIRLRDGGPNIDIVYRYYPDHPYLKQSINFRLGLHYF